MSKYKERPFNYNLKRMQRLVEDAKTNSRRVPKDLKTAEEILEWMLKQ